MSESEDCLTMIKGYWPKFIISKENLLHPTQELVVRFYKNFLDDYYEKVSFLTGVNIMPDYNSGDIQPEEWLVQQLSKLFKEIDGLKFTLADIYQPTSIRTKNFFKVCIHFISFIECLLQDDQSDILGVNIFQTKKETENLLSHQQSLIDEINENAKAKAKLFEKKNSLSQMQKTTEIAYSEMKSLKTIREALYNENKNQIDNLKLEMQNKQHELKNLGNTAKDLSKQRITETEHRNILQTLVTLKSESEILDNDENDIGDGLEHENKVLQHNSDCRRRLHKCDFNVENVKKLINKENDLRIMSNTVNMLIAKQNPMKQKLKTDKKLENLEEQVINFQTEYKIIKDTYTNCLLQLSQKLTKCKNGFEEETRNNCKMISECEVDIKKCEEELEKLKKAFTTEYVKVSKIEKVAIDKFKEVLMKCKEMDQY